jgi:type II secretory pathway pseudopilin PulG
MFCTQCGHSNDDSAKFCASCGRELPSQDAATNQINIDAHTNENEFYKAVVGPKNQDYYVGVFSRFDKQGKAGASWHWPAFFVTFYWFLYRKMWLNALIYFVLPYLLMIPVGVAAAMARDSADMVVSISYIGYFLVLFGLAPMYANALYYKHCQQKIAQARASSSDVQRQLGVLSGKGGTSNIALIFVLIFAFVAFIGILAAIAIPAYQTYVMKARVVEALKVGGQAADSVANYYDQHQEIPANLAQAGFTAALPATVQELSLNEQNGVVVITLAPPPLNGKTLLIVPSLDSNKKIVWTCVSQNIEKIYLPQQCQSQ